MTMSAPKPISGLAEIASSYELIIFDLWGVLHNGEQPYPHVLECLESLAKTDQKVVFLSNAPRPNETVTPTLVKLGFDLDRIGGVVTSGDATVQRLSSRVDGNRPFHIGPERDKPLLEHTKLTETGEEDADFVLCSGLFDDTSETPDDYADLLPRLKARNLTMVCANPDILVIRGDRRIYCGGAIARAYAEIGGTVHYCGKPDPSIFSFTLDRMGVNADRALMVGDGGFTDILGANRSGLDSLFIAGGIHRDVLGLDEGRTGDALNHAIGTFLGENDLSATYWLEGVKW